MSAERRLLGLPLHWARIVLIASLALNFLALGVITGSIVKPDEQRGSNSYLTQQMIELTADDRKEDVANLLGTRREIYKDRRVVKKKEWTSLADVLGTSPTDYDALKAVFAGMRDTRDTSRAAVYDIITEAMMLMTEEERIALADRIRNYERERQK